LVQATLLSLGIAVILALVAALVGPLFIDWTHYRAAIEAEASRIVGAPVRVTGPVDVRLLPAPFLDLKEVEIQPAGSTKLAARRLTMEFGLGTLLRGEFRATEATIDGAELAIGLDRSGAVELPAASLGFDLDRLAIDRLTVGNGSIAFADAASGARLAVDNLELTGEVRSLTGPFTAEGSFAANGEHFNFRLSASRRGENGGMKLRLAVDAVERALAFDSDGTVWIEARAPRYEGAATLSRVVGTALPGGRVAINDPWKVTGKLTATAASAVVKELDLQYGPDVRSFHLAGSVLMNFGPEPRIASDFNARQIDLDRVLGGSEQKRLPFDLLRSMAESLAEWGAPSLPVRIGVGVDSVTVGGATLTGVRGDLEHNAEGWNIADLELRAPGATLLHVAGKLAMADRNVAFDGPVKLDSTDPAVFFAWVEGQSAAGRPSLGPMHGSGTVMLAGERIAVEGLAAEIDRKLLEGRLAYRFATAAKPARLDATLRAADLDFDRGIAAGNALFASTVFERPGEIALALDIGRATYAGVEARQAHAVLTYDTAGLKIERLSVADIGGASIEASGRIDGIGEAARGSIALTLAAPRLDAAAALADKFLPQASGMLRKYGARVLPLRVNARLDVEPRPGNPGTPGNPGIVAGARTAAKLKLDGKIAGVDINLDAGGTGDITDPAAATVRLEGRLNAPEARMLAALIGLDVLVNADARPARATFTIDGAADRGFKVDGKFAGADVNASAAGTLSLSGDGVLDVALRAADARLPRRGPGGAVPVDLKSQVGINVAINGAIDGATVTLRDLAGKLAGANVKGDLALGIGQPLKIDGRIEADQIDAAELTALFTGTPRAPPPPARPGRGPSLEWPAEPFAPSAVPVLEGRIEFRAAAARWAALTARQLAGSARFGPTGFSFSDVTGTLADGRLALDASFRRDAMGIELTSRVKLVNADLPVLLAGALRVPAVGRISLDAEARGQGLSAASLVGSLKGTGTVTVEQVEIAGLDPTAMDALIGALERDRALASNPGRVNDIANAGLDRGRLRLPFAAAPLVITDGRAQLLDFAAPAQNADIAGTLSLGLNDGVIDARLEMTGPRRANAPGPDDRPHMAVTVRGPLTAARRSADVAALANWVTVQRVEQDAKRFDEVEKEQRRIEAAAEVARRSVDGGTAPARRPPPPPQPPPPQPPQPFNLLDLFHGSTR
jgi:uncharacterized protein involved in outer membrane biogenesis